jgi:HSP20 family protein
MSNFLYSGDKIMEIQQKLLVKEISMTYYFSTYPTRQRVAHPAQHSAQEYRMPINVQEEDNTYVLTALVPGMNAEGLDVKVLEDTIVIEGQYQEDENSYLMRELPQGVFRRSLRFPTVLDAEKSEATVKDGLLTLRVAKAESALPRTIKISTN